MRINLLARFAGLCLLGLAACAGPGDVGRNDQWSEFRTPGADFVISVPSKPKVYKDVIEKDGGVWRAYMVDQGDVVYTIDYSVSGSGGKAVALDSRLDMLRDGFARGMKGKVRGERRFSVGANRATEVVIDVPKAEDGDAYVIKARFYLRRDQAGRDIWYKISVVGSPGSDANPNTARFLESFHFVAG